MAWPLDTDIFINYLRETCLSAAPNSQDKIISGFYNAENIKQNIDTSKHFPLLSSIFNDSPPISPYILDNQFKQRFNNDSSSTINSFKKQSKSIFDDKNIEPKLMHPSTGDEETVIHPPPPAPSPPLPPDKLPPQLPHPTELSSQSSISSSESDKSLLSVPKAAPPPIPEHSLTNISQSTTIKSEEKSLTSDPKNDSANEMTPPLPARPQLSHNSNRKPSVQSTTDSIDSGISNGSNIKQLLTENNSNSNSNSNGNGNTSISSASKQSLPQSQPPVKSKNKGILSLGRFIRPKHITSTLQHHSNIIDEEKTISSPESSIDKNFSNNNWNSNDINDNSSLKSKNTISNYKSYSESNLIDHFEKEHFKKHNRHKSNLSHDHRELESQASSKNKTENDDDDDDDDDENEEEDDDDDNNNDDNNDDGDIVDIGGVNNNHNDRHDNDKNIRKPDNLLDESDEYDDEDDDSDVVDSIESSEIVDDDYDYFNSTYLDHSFAGDDEFSDDLDSDDYLSDSDYLVGESLNDQGITEIDNNNTNANNSNLASKINFTSSRPISSGATRHRSTSLKWKKSFPNIQNLQNLQLSHDQLKGLKRNVKSSNSLISIKADLSYGNNNPKNKNNNESDKKNEFVFEKLDLNDIKNKKIEYNNNSNNNLHNNIPSKLTLLINKKTISLDYYKYVEIKKSEFDNLINVKVMIPAMHINYENELNLKINDSVHVFELIGYILYKLNDKVIKENSEKHFEANYWKLYLADDDGEVEDDLGVLDRTRIVKSYGADEFVLIECSKDEIKLNEKLTPSPLENTNNNSNNANKQSPIVSNSNGYNNNGTILESITPQVKHTRDISVATLPSNLTPVSGLGFDNNNSPQLYNKQKLQKKGKNALIDEDYDSEEEEEENEEDDADYDGNTDRKSKSNNRTNRGDNNGHASDHDKKHHNNDKKYNYITSKFNSTPKDSKLNKFKNHNKTIQTILHNTASYYQQQRQELFRNPNANEIDEFNNANNLTMYHRWTVWRRQQMTFKNKHPKTLAVDGYQIYILPFNEFKGSWYESKTYSFNISQILKVKQNAKVPNYFKIVINKNADGIVKKYYLEAKNANECKEIVDTIRGLAAGYNENPMV